MSDFPSPLTFDLWVYGTNAVMFVLENLLWIGLALYGWVLWRRARGLLAALPGPGQVADRRAILRSSLWRFARILGLCAVLSLVTDLAHDARMRGSAHDCKRSLDGSGTYIGEECSVDGARDNNSWGQGTRYWGLLSVYDARSGALLAREFVPQPESNIQWDKDAVWQQGGDSNGTNGARIALPPTAWERLKARLP